VLVEHKLMGEVADWATDLLKRLGSQPVRRWARVAAVAAAGARFAGDLERAAALARQAIDRSEGDVTVTVYAHMLLTEADFFAGRLEQVIQPNEEIAATVARHPHLEPMMQMIECERLLARAYAGSSEMAGPARQVQQRAERNGWPVVAAWALYVRGEVVIDTDPAQAGALLQKALERARAMDERYLSGVALVALASARSRHGDPHGAVEPFAEVVRHWRDRGDWTHQWTTLRNVVDLLVRLGRTEPAAVLAAALLDPDRSAAGYGADAVRLSATAAALATTIDGDRHTELVSRGRSLTDQQVVASALTELSRSVMQPVEAEEPEVVDWQDRHLAEPSLLRVRGQD